MIHPATAFLIQYNLCVKKPSQKHPSLQNVPYISNIPFMVVLCKSCPTGILKIVVSPPPPEPLTLPGRNRRANRTCDSSCMFAGQIGHLL